MKWATTASLNELVQAFFCYPVMEVGTQPKVSCNLARRMISSRTAKPRAASLNLNRWPSWLMATITLMLRLPWRCMHGRLNAAPSYLDLCPPYMIMVGRSMTCRREVSSSCEPPSLAV